MFVFYIIFFLLASSSAVAFVYPYPSSRLITLRPDMMSKCMLGDLTIDETSFYPDEKYSNNYQSRGGAQECKYSSESFFSYLTIIENRPCDYETGKENKLRDWILNQKDNTIDPVSIFRKSMELNKNHVFNSLLTVHQLLRNEARWRSKRYYNYKSTDELEAKFWSKFIDIRGDLAVLGNENEGDHQGSWYRIWGIAMYRMTLLDKKLDANKCEHAPVPSIIDNLKTSAVGLMGELAKYLFDITPGGYSAGNDRPGKARINNTGAKLGNDLLKFSHNTKLTDRERKDCADKKYIFRQFIYSEKPLPKDASGF